MNVKDILLQQWQYFPEQKLLVLALGNEVDLKKQELVDELGRLNNSFKIRLTEQLQQDALLEGHVGPFGDTDFFSGIEDEQGELQYFIEIHQMEKEQAIKFNDYYPVIFIQSSE